MFTVTLVTFFYFNFFITLQSNPTPAYLFTYTIYRFVVSSYVYAGILRDKTMNILNEDNKNTLLYFKIID